MNKILEINNLNFSYNKSKILFRNFNIDFNHNINIIIGPPCSGKTTLFNIIGGMIITDSVIVEGIKITKNNLSKIYSTIGIITTDYSFITTDIYNELAFTLENQGKCLKEISTIINEVSKKFNLIDKINIPIDCLSMQDQLMVYIASYLISDIKVLLIDECFNMLSTINKQLIIDYAVSRSIQLIIFTSNIEDALLAKYIYILNDGKIVLEGTKALVLKEEKILKRLGLSLPKIVDISMQLNSYKVVDKAYYDVESLGAEIWK